ncbi:hypothetical protein BJP40_09615 [Streptomyces sp. CC53]|nr:hypothetical protein BJP40_09615 [Streptomyces sp. CC53]
MTGTVRWPGRNGAAPHATPSAHGAGGAGSEPAVARHTWPCRTRPTAHGTPPEGYGPAGGVDLGRPAGGTLPAAADARAAPDPDGRPDDPAAPSPH